ncbi:NAD(P)-dependent oxidoreductase [Pseudonocardia sichuanensis]
MRNENDSGDDEKAVAVLGLGAMGTALAEAFLAAGRPTTVWNRTPAKAEALAARGAVAAPTLTGAVRASQLVVVCLLDHASVHEALDPVADELAGRVLVNLTNGTPSQARELASWAAAHGAELLDGGIMAVPPMIGTPAAFVLYSGPQEAFDAHRGALDALGESVYVGSDHGQAALRDLALLSGMYGMYMGVMQAFALTRGEVPATEFAPMLRRWLTGMGELVDSTAAQLDSGDYVTGVVSNLAMQTAAYPNFLAVAQEQGVRPDFIAPLYPLMQRRVADGFGHEDVTGVIDLLRIDQKEN